MNVGIVGHEVRKFTPRTERQARVLIERLLAPQSVVLVSGRSPLGGIDVWAEEIADRLGRKKIIHPPTCNNWTYGFKPRNLRIAQDSQVVHVIVLAPEALNPDFHGMRFQFCYHCKTALHVKSGGCWTAIQAERLGKKGVWHVIR